MGGRRTIVAVDTALGVVLVLVAGLTGLAVGGSLALRRPSRAPVQEPGDIPTVPREEIMSFTAAVPEPVVVLDATDTVVASNGKGAALGVVRDGRLRAPALLTLVRAARRDRQVHEAVLELPVRSDRGSRVITLTARAAPLDPGERVALIMEDRTEARRVDDVRRDFVANVSHELKTPVGGLGLLAEAVADAAEDPVAVRRFADRMQHEAARLSAMVQDLLALSRLQADEASTPGTPVALDAVVAEALDRCRTAASGKDILLDVRTEPGLCVLGEDDQLVTAVRNLIDNAVAYSPPGTRVSVAARRQGATAEISVSDQGIGIPAGDLERIFERFYRVDPARSRETGGTGLGLSIVKHAVANHGGEVTVWSREGIGSTFTIRLPLLSAPPPGAAVAPPLPAGAVARAGRRVEETRG